MLPDRGAHRLDVAEQPVDLALVHRDAADLALELVADVGVAGRQVDALGDAVERALGQVVERS